MPITFERYAPLITPDRTVSVRTVDDAIVTPFSRQPIPSYLAAPRFLQRGAVYDGDRKLVLESQRWGGYRGDFFVAADPPQIETTAVAEHLPGTWLYVGNWMGQFGHWISETLTNLWALPHVGGLAGILAHPFTFANDITAWQTDLLEDAGARGIPVRVLTNRVTSVQRLHVPTRPVVLNAYALPEAVTVWERVAEANQLVTPRPRLYFSVTAHRSGAAAKPSDPRRSFDNQSEIDDVFAAHGFHVVAPEEHSIREQIGMVRGAGILAGWSGSSLHLSAFATSTTRVLELGDIRSGGQPVPQQRAITAARGQQHAFLPSAQRSDERRPYDLDRLSHILGELLG